MDYTAEQIVKKLKDEENVLISVRTLNYYAYDKKMFPQLKHGKSCYSDTEYELLKRIAFLKEKSSMTLEDIKQCILDDEQYNSKVNSIMADTVDRFSKATYTSANNSGCYGEVDSSEYSLRSTSFSTSGCTTLDASQSLTCLNSVTMMQDETFATPTNASFGGFRSCETMSLDDLNDYFEEKPKIEEEKFTTVKINRDVTITVSKNISRERLIEIVNFINQK